MKNPKTAAGRRGKKPTRTHAYPFEFRLRVVRLHLEEGYSRPLLAEQFGISTHPHYGPRRIADVLRRFFLMPASASTVHRELSSRGLTDKGRRKPVKNPSKPRFFERARPNQGK